MYSTINSYRNDINREDLAALAADRRLARSAARHQPGRLAPAARSLAASRQVAFALCAVLALLIALAVPFVAAPLV
jgi:hypothetical protein